MYFKRKHPVKCPNYPKAPVCANQGCLAALPFFQKQSFIFKKIDATSAHNFNKLTDLCATMKNTSPKKIVIIGGGAAGFFFAANAAAMYPNWDFTILEMGKKVLSKVLVSGGGRCNVTHECYDPVDLVQYYPRGNRELLGPFYHFGPLQLISWFEERDVPLKTEADGRMFPTTNDSATIANCLQQTAFKNGVKVITSCKVTSIEAPSSKHTQFLINTKDRYFKADKLFIGAGSTGGMWTILTNLGHKIVPPVPSLFTFKTKNTVFKNLAGVSVPHAVVKIVGSKLEAAGPLLITHWGLSGPAILKLSAWGAKYLHGCNYRFEIQIDWLPDTSESDIKKWQQLHAKKQVLNHNMTGLPKRLWQNMVGEMGKLSVKKWGDVSKVEMGQIISFLKNKAWAINGKSTFKEEFVTAGGVDLKEIDFTNFESKVIPNLYMAGEVLNIDAVTGGFNFQAAWTGAFLAAEGLAGSR